MAELTAAPEGPDEEELLERFGTWDSDCSSHWSAWATEARELFGFYAGRQYSSDDETKAKDEKVVLVTFNRFASIIDAVAGAEITDREQVQYFPREIGDTKVNELLTEGAEWIRDRSDAEFEESEAYKDALICGLGCTETRMDYDEEPDGQIVVDRVDPLEVRADPKARKPNLADARYIRRKKVVSKDTAKQMFPDKTFGAAGDDASTSTNNPREAYDGEEDDAPPGKDEVEICEYQWFEQEWFGRVADGAEIKEISGDELEARLGEPGLVRQSRRVYYRAYRSGRQLLAPPEKLNVKAFTYKFITGKRDRNKGTWFGLGRLMKDPQRWANVFFSRILHILNTNALGGVMVDPAGVDDVRKFEEDWSKPGKVHWTPPGALIGGQGAGVVPKPAPGYPQGLDRLMTIAVEAIQDSTGVNKEMLGMVERQQAGVLEHQRKQAAYGILAAFFDSLRRYRRSQGLLMLQLMKYLPSDTLVRVSGKKGADQYVQLAMDDDTVKFDVIVDEAPAGPNQKERTFAMLTQLMPLLKDANLPADVWAEVARYSPLPSAISEKIAQALTAQAQQPPDPAAEAGKAAALAEQQGKARKVTAEAEGQEIENDQAMTFGPIDALAQGGALGF